MPGKLLTFWTAGLTAIVLTVGTHRAADAAVTVIAQETGGDVVFTSTGSLNLAGLNQLPFGGGLVAEVDPSIPSISLGASPTNSASVDIYVGASNTGPFGSGSGALGDSGSGPRWGAAGTTIGVPRGYTLGDSLAASLTFTGETFASLGMDLGTYVWSWSTDSVTLKVVPLPAALPLLGTALAGLGLVARRRKTIA